MITSYLTIPTTSTYGFEGVTSEEFAVWQDNVRGIINQAGFYQVGRARESTDTECVVWADRPREYFCVVSDATGVSLEPVKQDDEVVDVTWEFYYTLSDVDLFQPIGSEDKQALAQKWVKSL